MQNGMVPQPQQMHHMHPPQASPLDSQGGHSPTSSNTSQTPQTTPTSSSGHTPNPAPSNREVPKICGRPGCNNPVQRGANGWQNDFCSNECVVGQCKDVYSSWTSSTQTQPTNNPGQSGPNPGQGGPNPMHPQQQAMHPQQQHQGAYNAPPPQGPPVVTAATAAVK